MLKRIIVTTALVATFTAHTPTEIVTHFEKSELSCLVRNIYFEARGESLLGQVAVAKVTLNRAKNLSVCEVVYAPKQFSWTSTKYKLPVEIPMQIYTAAYLALNSNFSATHYHATHVNPAWATKLTKLGQIGNHVFYR